MMQPHTHPRGDEVVHGITGARLAHLGALQQCLLRCVSCQLFVWASAQLLLALAKQVTQTEPDASLVARCDSGNVLVYKPGAQGQPWTAARASAHPDTQRLRLAEEPCLTPGCALQVGRRSVWSTRRWLGTGLIRWS